MALGATLVLGSLAGEREVDASEFYKGLFETDLRPGELILAVKFPRTAAGTAVGFAELARRRGDFALAGIALVAVIQRQRIDSARVVYFGCVDRPRLASAVCAAIAGLTIPLQDNAFEAAIHQDLTPDDTPGLRADTKLQMAKVLTRRVLNSLSQRVAA